VNAERALMSENEREEIMQELIENWITSGRKKEADIASRAAELAEDIASAMHRELVKRGVTPNTEHLMLSAIQCATTIAAAAKDND